MSTYTLNQGDSLVISNCILLRAVYVMGIGSDMTLRGASATLITPSGAYREVRNGEDFRFIDGERLLIPVGDYRITVRARTSREDLKRIDLEVGAPDCIAIQIATPITDTPARQSEPINWFKLLAGPVALIVGVAACAYFDGWLTALVFIASTVLFFILG